jgi:hypothetical protein
MSNNDTVVLCRIAAGGRPSGTSRFWVSGV